MGKIQLTPSELMAQSSEMASLKAEYEVFFQDVSQILGQVNMNWSANLSNNFEGKITSAKNSFIQINNMLQLGADVAAKSASGFSNVDDLLSKQFFGMTEDGNVPLPGVSVDFFSITGLGGELNTSWRDAGEAARWLEELRETEVGKTFEDWYDIAADILSEETELGQIKKAYEITSDILSGDVGWDTAKTAVEAITDSPKVDAVLKVIDICTDETGYYVQRGNALEAKAFEQLKQGNIVGGTYTLLQEFVEVVGKGTVDVGCQLVVDTFHLGTVNKIIRSTTGYDIGARLDKAGAYIGDTVSDVLDSGDGAIDNALYEIGTAGVVTANYVGNTLSDVGDFLGSIFK